jgi:hypothetical protein
MSAGGGRFCCCPAKHRRQPSVEQPRSQHPHTPRGLAGWDPNLPPRTPTAVVIDAGAPQRSPARRALGVGVGLHHPLHVRRARPQPPDSRPHATTARPAPCQPLSRWRPSRSGWAWSRRRAMNSLCRRSGRNRHAATNQTQKEARTRSWTGPPGRPVWRRARSRGRIGDAPAAESPTPAPGGHRRLPCQSASSCPAEKARRPTPGTSKTPQARGQRQKAGVCAGGREGGRTGASSCATPSSDVHTIPPSGNRVRVRASATQRAKRSVVAAAVWHARPHPHQLVPAVPPHGNTGGGVGQS